MWLILAWQIGVIVETGSMPWGVTVSPDGATVYVTHVGQKDRDTVRRLDAASLDTEARAAFDGHAVESELRGDRLYVTNSREHEVVVLDAVTLDVIERHATGDIPKDLALSPDGARVYTADYGDGTLTEIDLATGARRSVEVGKRARGVAVSADGATIYVASMKSRTLTLVDAATLEVRSRTRTCKSPRHVAVAGDAVLVTCMGARKVDVLDAATGERRRTVRVGRGPKTIAVSGDGRLAATADEQGDTITLIDLRSWDTERVAVPVDQPCGLAFAPGDDRIYVTARGSDELVVVERVMLGGEEAP